METKKASKGKVSVIIANLTWNPTGWRGLYTNPHAGHRYARKYPGHESLNFRFDKSIDTPKRIHGFVQWTYRPKQFKKGGIVLFHSNNLDNGKGEFVGIYCNTEIIDPPINTKYKGFQNGKFISNLKAERAFSLLFPIPLIARKFARDKFDPQVGYTYKDVALARKIVIKEIHSLQKANIKLDEYNKLLSIHEFITGHRLSSIQLLSDDEAEQEELIDIYSNLDEKSIINDLKAIKSSGTEIVLVKQKKYKRDNKSIALLKLLRKFKCQICGTRIRIRNNRYYIEAAHIVPKSKNGPEIPNNIVILCPNHHKEFDFSEKVIHKHSEKLIKFDMNGKTYEINLSLE